ncbi:MAG: hypothetical protein C4342_06860, partial [Armatimonadota bacterium]
IERIAAGSVDPNIDDVIGLAEADGRVHLMFGLPIAEILSVSGGSAKPGGVDGDLQINRNNALAPLLTATGGAPPQGAIARRSGSKWVAATDLVEIPADHQPGDLFYSNGAALMRLPVTGVPDGYVLTKVAGLPAWAAPGAAPPFDPANFALSGYWVDPVGAPDNNIGSAVSEWVGKPSAGTSGGRKLLGGGGATIGANLGTHRTVFYDGVGNYHSSDFKLGDIVSGPSYFVQIVYRADAAAAAAAQPYKETALLGDNGGNFYLSHSASGLRGGHFDNAAFRVTSYVSAPISVTHVVQMWFDGTNISLSVDGGTAVTAAADAVWSTALTAAVPRVGTNLATDQYFKGRIAQIIAMKSVPSSADRNAFLSHAQGQFF